MSRALVGAGGNRISAFRLLASLGPPIGNVILLHEIFGLDSFMRDDAARWSSAGYDVIAPSLFDRIEPAFSATRSPEGIAKGWAAMTATPDPQVIEDIAACVREFRTAAPVFIVGYCYGGRLAWQAAGLLDGLAGATVYYGNILPHADRQLRCPVLCHFGALDAHLPVIEIRDAIASRHPEVPFHVYANAGHGFNNRSDIDGVRAAAEIARSRTLAFFAAAGSQ